jgi:hypothetical protein
MNQEHPQPKATDYESGNPDSWAETPTENQSVEKEYEGGRVKRNEMGFAEFRDDTWKHKDSEAWHDGKKYDNQRSAAERKASAVERISRSLLRGASSPIIEESAMELMSLPDRFVVSHLKRLDSLNPDLLPPQTRFNRALACSRLAARTLGSSAKEDQVQRLGSVYMGLDDPTLKTMLKIASEVRIAEDDGDEEEESGEETAAAPPATDKDAEAPETAACDTPGMSAADMATLDAMLAEAAGGGAAAPAVAPPVDDLTILFTEPAPAAPAMHRMPPAMPMAASTAAGPEITFDEEEEEADITVKTAASDVELEDIFNDLPDVQAQRQFKAAAEEQAMREGGYGSPAASRTASTQTARKLGNVRAAGRATEDESLSAIWDRPGPRG